MSAEAIVLREAAKKMREEHGRDHPRHGMWEAIAALLEQRSAVWLTDVPTSQDGLALHVAETYLEAPR